MVTGSSASPPGTNHDLAASVLANFICSDFRTAWDAVASIPGDAGAKGNFMFARQAMSLIELAGRTCAADSTGQALFDLSLSLEAIEPRYFTLLPGPCARPGKNRNGVEWTLPSKASAHPPEAQLLWVLFDLIRHGQAHTYQQIMVELNDTTIWGISLTGAKAGRTLCTVAAARPRDHLSQKRSEDGSLWLVVRPEVMFLDFESAIAQGRVFGRQLEPIPLRRKAKTGGPWDFTQTDLEHRLRADGH